MVPVDRGFVGRVLLPRGIRHGRRDAAGGARPGPRRGRHRTAQAPDADHHRPPLGRQRGVADHGGRRDVRGVPALVRVPVRGLLPPVAADPRRSDHPGTRPGIPRQGRHRRVAARLGHRDHGGLVPAGPAVGRRVREHRQRSAARRADDGILRQPVHAAQPSRPPRWADDAGSVPDARRAVRSAEDRRRDPPGRASVRDHVGAGDGGGRRDLPGLDERQHGRRRLVGAIDRRGGEPAGGAGGDPRRPRRMGLHGDVRLHRADGGGLVHGPVPGRAAELEPGSVRAERDDRVEFGVHAEDPDTSDTRRRPPEGSPGPLEPP